MIIDTAVNVTNRIPHLKAAGVTSIIRYLNPLWPAGEKNIKLAEVKAIQAAGLRLGLVNEGWGDFAHGGISAGAGTRDAEYSLVMAGALGAPIESAVIYFAIDTDATPSQINSLVVPYFQSIENVNKSRFGNKWKIGVYGSGAVCQVLKSKGLVYAMWLACSMGWLGSRHYASQSPTPWTLLQRLPSTVAGIDVDVDVASGDFGDFVPFSDSPKTEWVAVASDPTIGTKAMGAPGGTMADAQKEYTIVANAIIPVLDTYVNENVPDMFGYRAQALAAMPAVAGGISKAAVDALAAAAVITFKPPKVTT